MRQETTPSSSKAHTEPLSGCCNLKGTRRVLLAAQAGKSMTSRLASYVCLVQQMPNWRISSVFQSRR